MSLFENKFRLFAGLMFFVFAAMPSFATAEDEYKADYPPYIECDEQKIQFTVQCVVAYKFTLKTSSDAEEKALSERRLSQWEAKLEELVEKKKTRKKLIKAEGKSYEGDPQNPMTYLNTMKNVKKQLQCDHPTEDLRKIG